MTFPRLRRKRRPHFNGSPDDHAATELLASLTTDPEDGATFQWGGPPGLPEVITPGDIKRGRDTPPPARDWAGASDIGVMVTETAGSAPLDGYRPAPASFPALPPAAAGPEPSARLRAEPRYQPPEPVPAGYADTTGPMPAIGRPAVSIGDALTRDDQWGPKLAPLPCGHCGTPPPVPDGILERTRIIGHVNWLAARAGWRFDADFTLTCPPCQQDEAWKARQGQMEVRWPDGWSCRRHDANDPDADCTCPAAVLAVDVMLASEDHLGSGRGQRTAGAR